MMKMMKEKWTLLRISPQWAQTQGIDIEVVHCLPRTRYMIAKSTRKKANAALLLELLNAWNSAAITGDWNSGVVNWRKLLYVQKSFDCGQHGTGILSQRLLSLRWESDSMTSEVALWTSSSGTDSGLSFITPFKRAAQGFSSIFTLSHQTRPCSFITLHPLQDICCTCNRAFREMMVIDLTLELEQSL